MEKEKFISMLVERKDTPAGAAVIAAMVAILEQEDRFVQLYELYEGLEEFGCYVSEEEAKCVVGKFINYDKSRGGKWSMEEIEECVKSFGGSVQEKRHHNKWALYVLMNEVHSDSGGVLTRHAQGVEYVKLCYMLALAKIDNPDKRESIRESLGLEG